MSISSMTDSEHDHLDSMLDELARQLSALSSRQRAELVEKFLGADACRKLGICILPPDFVLSVVIPVYNEVRTVEEVVRRVRNSGVNCEVILVDDGSTDGTREILEKLRETPNVKVVFHETNQGKGGALRTGFRHVTGHAVVIQDADLEYDPAEYPFL